jgi:outer membrane protein assembly factor BamB
VGTVDFDPGPATYNLSSSGAQDVYVWKLDASGNLIWAGAVGAPENQARAYGVAIDANGNVYVTGSFQGIADLDPGPGTSLFSSFSSFTCVDGSSRDGFVLKLECGGLTPLWVFLLCTYSRLLRSQW